MGFRLLINININSYKDAVNINIINIININNHNTYLFLYVQIDRKLSQTSRVISVHVLNDSRHTRTRSCYIYSCGVRTLYSYTKYPGTAVVHPLTNLVQYDV